MDQPIRLAVLQIAGAYAVWVVVDLLPLGIFCILLWPVWIAVYIGLLADALDLELNDVILLAIVTAVARWFVRILIVSQFLN